MKRFFTRIFRFFWSWGFLKFVLFAITLVVLLYVEEDWRGTRMWAATKEKWEARGETFDLSHFVPPQVPDNENLAALPIFAMTKGSPSYPQDEILTEFHRAIYMRKSEEEDGPEIPSRVSPRGAVLTDMVAFHAAIARNYAIVFKGQAPPNDASAQVDAVYPFTAELRAALPTHRYFRFDSDYGTMPPSDRALGPVTDMIALAKIMTDHAILALDEKRPDLALEDLKVNLIVANGLGRDPDLVSGLVAIGITAISRSAIYQGLAEKEWSDAQWDELEQMLHSIRFLNVYQFEFRAEPALVVANLSYYEKVWGWNAVQSLRAEGMDANSIHWSRIPLHIPGGWWDENKSLITDFLLTAVGAVDPARQVVNVDLARKLADQADQAAKRWDAFAPWRIWYPLAIGPLSNALHSFAEAQVWLDEARIACALERYRLAHNAYPATLDALVPSCIDELPRDVINGEPYHYRLRADGTFLLYSVGWNQRDDGGVEVTEDRGPRRDYTKGDWVWPTLKK